MILEKEIEEEHVSLGSVSDLSETSDIELHEHN